MSLKYQSGEEIKKEDRVLFHGVPAEIELVASEPGDPEADWFIREHCGGVMILEGVAGRTFITANQLLDYEDVEFVSRADK